MPLFNLLAVDNFNLVRGVTPRNVSEQALETVRNLHEVDEMEPWVQAILFDTNNTPHGPSEIVDILTHRRFVGKEHCVVIDFIGNFRNAYTVVENLGLEPFEQGDPTTETTSGRSAKEILNLPAGCVVEFDERVIDVFGSQTMDPRFATRQNIARILIHQYKKIERRLGRQPTKMDVDRSTVIGSRFYAMVFGSWREFVRRMDPQNRRGLRQ